MCDNIAIVEVLLWPLVQGIFGLCLPFTFDNFQKLYEFIDFPIWVDVHLDLTLLNHDI